MVAGKKKIIYFYVTSFFLLLITSQLIRLNSSKICLWKPIHPLKIDPLRSQKPPMMTLQHDRVYNTSHDIRDIVVFFHIQKTGGKTFLSHLLTSITIMENVTMCKGINGHSHYSCPLEKQNSIASKTENWLASEKTYGWMCGVHPFLSEIKSCLNQFLIKSYGEKNRQYHYMTILRNPVMRYVSEYYHVVRGATWQTVHYCDGQNMSEYLQPCYPGFYDGKTWNGVTFYKFMNCSTNFANNRQTKMIAHLKTVECLDPAKSNMSNSKRDSLLLESAKANLMEMSFFGFTDYLIESCLLFERQFNVKFGKPCEQKNTDEINGGMLLDEITFNKTLRNSVELVNQLDMQLYNFALTLFIARLEDYNIEFSGTVPGPMMV